jgi:hypothetical protein
MPSVPPFATAVAVAVVALFSSCRHGCRGQTMQLPTFLLLLSALIFVPTRPSCHLVQTDWVLLVAVYGSHRAIVCIKTACAVPQHGDRCRCCSRHTCCGGQSAQVSIISLSVRESGPHIAIAMQAWSRNRVRMQCDGKKGDNAVAFGFLRNKRHRFSPKQTAWWTGDT